jgi:hypothetical protein
VGETSDTASGAAGEVLAGERNEQCNKRRRGQGLVTRKKRAIKRAARWTRGRQENETSGAARGAAGNASARERNERCSERRRGQDVDK